MKKLNPYLILLVFLTSISIQAQERGIPTYVDYLTDNLYLVHPSMAGASAQTKLRLTGRRQWFDIDDAPALETASLNGRLGENVGLGTIIYNDSNGRFSQQGVYATFAYHLLLSRNRIDLNQLSFGLSVGVLQEKLDESDLVGGPNPNDPTIAGVEQQDSFFNADFGMSYYLFEFFAHATVKNLIPQQRDIFSEEFESDNQRQYLISAGYIIDPFSIEWSFEPSILFQVEEATSEASIDVNFKAYREFDFGRLWGGLSYRRSFDGAEYTTDGRSTVENQKLQYISPFVGINYNRLMFAYTYTYQANSIVLSNSGFHQITLGYNFGEDDDRYECNCPAINY